MPYVTQELPRYGEFLATRRQVGEIQIGLMHRGGGQYVPIQIPGYVSSATGSEEHSSQLGVSSPPTLSHRVSLEKLALVLAVPSYGLVGCCC